MSEIKQIFVCSKQQAVIIAKEILGSRLDERFGVFSRDPLDYHHRQHSERVAQWARKGLETIRKIAPELVPLEDLALVEIEAMGHDVVQRASKKPYWWRIRWGGYKQDDISPGLREEMRQLGLNTMGNERASGYEILELLTRFVYPEGTFVFPVDDAGWREEVMADVGTTFPRFEKTADGAPKVWQPYLLPTTSLRGFCLANADMRSHLAESPEIFNEIGDAEFRELWWELTQFMREDGDVSYFKNRHCVAARILDWMREQAGFIREQEKLFLESLEENLIINAHSEQSHIKFALRELYGCPEHGGGAFDRNITAAHQRHVVLESHYGHFHPAVRNEKLVSISKGDVRRLLIEIGYRVYV